MASSLDCPWRMPWFASQHLGSLADFLPHCLRNLLDCLLQLDLRGHRGAASQDDLLSLWTVLQREDTGPPTVNHVMPGQPSLDPLAPDRVVGLELRLTDHLLV